MPPIERFEDLVTWRKSRDLSREIYALTQQPKVARDFGFSSQIQRAAVSTMSNIGRPPTR